MALINCSECGKEVSDKSQHCIHCGNPIAFNNENTQVRESKTKKKKNRKGLVLLFTFVLIVAAGVGYFFINQLEQKEADYRAKLIETYGLMGFSNVVSGNVITTVGDIWHDAIYKESNTNTFDFLYDDDMRRLDFNDAIDKYYSDTKSKNEISKIDSYLDDITIKMKELSNPPDTYQKAYEILDEMFEIMIEISNFAISPSGSYDEFGKTTSNLFSDFDVKYQLFKSALSE